MSRSSILLGCRRANSSIALGISRAKSRWTARKLSSDKRAPDIDERNVVFVRFSPLNDLSAEHVVTGSVHKMLSSTRMFGYIELAYLSAPKGLEGKLLAVKYNDIHNWLVCRGVLEHEKHHARYASVRLASFLVAPVRDRE